MPETRPHQAQLVDRLPPQDPDTLFAEPYVGHAERADGSSDQGQEQQEYVVPLEPSPQKLSVRGLKNVLRFGQRRNDSRVQARQEDEGLNQAEISETDTTSEFHQAVSEYVTDTALVGRVRELKRVLDTPLFRQIGTFHQYMTQSRADMHAALRRGDREQANRYDAEYDDRQKQEYDPIEAKDKEAYNQHKRALDEAERGRITLSSEDPGTEALLDHIKSAHLPGWSPDDRADAPFAGYKDNTTEAWQQVPDEDVRSFLSAKAFLDVSRYGNKTRSVTVEAKKDSPLEVPSDSIVYAEGFTSWQGQGEGRRRNANSEYGNEEMSSLDVIKHYAGLPTEIPPVGEIRAYIQPDGTVFCDNESGDSHRIAAALLRGQATVKAEKITFIPLDKNVLKPEDLRTK
jgi:hypothetical protein